MEFVSGPGGTPPRAISDDPDGRPPESVIARTVTRTVTPPGTDPPVVLCEIRPTCGAPAFGAQAVTGSLPVTISESAAAPPAWIIYSWSESNVHSPGNSASFAAACTW